MEGDRGASPAVAGWPRLQSLPGCLRETTGLLERCWCLPGFGEQVLPAPSELGSRFWREMLLFSCRP